MLTTRRRFIQASMAVTASAEPAQRAQTSRAGGPSGVAAAGIPRPVQRQGPDRLGRPRRRRENVVGPRRRAGVLRPSQRRDEDRSALRELRAADRLDAHRAGRELGPLRVDRRRSQVERDRDSDPRPRLGEAARPKRGSLRRRLRTCTASSSRSAATSSSPTIRAARAACRSRTARKGGGSGTPTPSRRWTARSSSAVNGKFVNGISQSAQKKGYLGLQAEGAEIHFRNIRIMELPPGVTAPEQVGTIFP